MTREKMDGFGIDTSLLIDMSLFFDLSDQGAALSPDEVKDELRELGFSESEVSAFTEANGKIEDYFLLLNRNSPDALRHVDGGWLIHWYEHDDRGRIPYVVRLRTSELVTMDESAKESGVNIRTIQRWLKEGLKSFKIDGRVLIPYDDLDKFGRGRDHHVGEISND